MTIDIERPMLTAAEADGGRRKAGFLQAILARFMAYLEKRGTRWDLRALTDDQLRDIGMTRAEARTEANKSWFWS